MNQEDHLMEKIVSLCKRRGFIFPGSEIYGGLANSWDYGPLGVELKNNIKHLWWERFVHHRSDIVGIDSALVMNSKVWEASGHVATFNDPMVECKKCHERYRETDFFHDDDGYIKGVTKGSFEEHYNQTLQKRIREKGCKICRNKNIEEFTKPQQFNLMFRTNIGPVESEKNTVYLRPETAQGMFVNFKNILDTTRQTIPFGIAQIGKAFRNEITPGNFIFRTREFEMMEIEYFIAGKDWEKHFEYWRNEMKEWIQEIGITLKHIHELEVPAEERAHYSKRTIDFEYKFPFGTKELYGLAYRTDFDLTRHQEKSGHSLEYVDSTTGEKFVPHVIEPTWGVDRSVLAVLCEAYNDNEKDRIVLELPPKLAPYKAAVFPLLANKPKLVELARKIYDNLRPHFTTAWDDRGNIGKRYYAQDEIGTPFGITVDFQSLEDDTVTVRDRDTTKQVRVKISELKNYIADGSKWRVI